MIRNVIGKEIGPYRILRLIGKGGMGVVYQGVHTKLDQQVAVKVMTPEYSNEEGMRDRFIREARLQAQISHPNVVNIFNYLEDNNDIFLVMEYVPGRTLEQMLQDSGALPLPEILHIMDGVLSALEFMHGRGIIHRDIKPANIMITESGQVKVTDFGIAKAVGEKGMTRTGTALGTVWYMSPERIRGEPIGHPADIYALGITLYQMATGQVPFSSDSEYEVMRAHIEDPPPPTGINSDIPQSLSDIILKTLAKAPQDRFESAKAFREALNRVSVTDLSHMQTRAAKDQGILWAKPDALLERMKSWVVALNSQETPFILGRYTRKQLALLVAVAAMLVCLLVIFFMMYSKNEDTRNLPLVQQTAPAVTPQGSLLATRQLGENGPKGIGSNTPDNSKPLPQELLPTPQEIGIPPKPKPEKIPEKIEKPPQDPGDYQEKTPRPSQPQQVEKEKPRIPVPDSPQQKPPSEPRPETPEKPAPKDAPPISATPQETPHAVSPPTTSPKATETKAATSPSAQYVRMLQSPDPVDKQRAAKTIFRHYLHDPNMEALANTELLISYQKNPDNRYHVDAMAWLCNILGASGNPKFRSTLEKVSQDAPHRKLREYAAKNLKKL